MGCIVARSSLLLSAVPLELAGMYMYRPSARMAGHDAWGSVLFHLL